MPDDSKSAAHYLEKMLMTIRNWAWGAAICTALLLAACSGANETEQLSAAKASLAKKDQKSAMVQLKAILQQHPNSGEARYLLGVALMDEGDYPSAVLELNKSRELGYDDNKVLPKLARAMLITGKAKAVLEGFADRAITEPSAKAELHTALAVAHAQLGQAEPTASELQVALTAAPTFPWALQTKARLVAAKGDFDQALKLVEQSVVPGAPDGAAWLLRGDLLLRGKQDWDGAIESYRKALADTSHARIAHLSIIGVHIMRQQVKEAEAQVEQLSKAYPNDVQTVFVQAQLAYLKKEHDKAKELLQPLLRMAPDNAKLLTFAGGIDLARGAVVMAEAELGKAVQLQPQAIPARKLLASAYLRLGQPQKMLVTLKPLLEGDRPDTDTLALAANAYLHEGDVLRAEALYNQAARIKPGDPNIRTALALTDLARGRTESAFDSLQAIAASDAGVSADLALINALLKRQEYDAALAAIARLQKKETGKPTASYLRGVALRFKRDLPAARAAFDEALTIEPAHYASLAALVSMDVMAQQLGQARQRLEAEIKRDGKNSAARMALMEVMARQGAKPAELLPILNETIRTNPTDPAPRLALVARLSAANDHKAALAAAQAAYTVLPDDFAVVDALGRMQAMAGDDQQAISTFGKAATLNQRSFLPYLRLADLYARRRDNPATVLNLKRAFDLAPEALVVQQRLIAQSLTAKNANVALDAAHDLQKRQPQRASGYLFEGDLHAASRRWDDALRAYRLALDKAGASDLAAVKVYQAQRSGGKLADADRFAVDWLKSHPRDIGFIMHLGDQAVARKDYATAERRFMDVLALDRRHLLALNNVAWLQAERGAPSALGFAEMAIAIAPGEAPFLDTLAKALAAAGKTDKAIEVQMQAVAIMPERPSYRLGLARLYVKAGLKDKAKEELDTLAALGAKFDGQSSVQQMRRALSL